MPKQTVRLLLVEDNIDQKELTLRAFRKEDPTVHITAVENGAACLETLNQNHFDAIILDYSLPMMDGLHVLAHIQREGRTTPVIMVTGQGDERIAVEAMKRGAYDYIIKTPRYQDALPMLVKKVIEKSQLQRSLQEASARARRLYEISLSVTTERKVGVLTETLIEGARRLLQTEGAILFLINSETSEIELGLSAGIEIDKKALNGAISEMGLFGLAYIEKKALTIENPTEDPGWASTPTHQPLARQILTVPLIRQGQIEGVLTVLNKKEEAPFSEQEVDTLSTLAVNATTAIDNARFLERMEKLAVTDSLTGFFNHQEFQRRLVEEVERGSRYGKEFSLLMLDIDHFKVFNDTHGHPVGDAILKEIVGIIRKCIRNVDIPARYGGEEFTVILPETIGERAKMVAERIRNSVSESAFLTPGGHPAHLSISAGVASFPLDATRREDLIIAADEALYFAKRGGRNAVCCYSDTLKSEIEKDQEKVAELLIDPKMKTIRDLAAAIDAKSPYTRGHTEGVIQYAMLLGDALNLTEEDKESLRLASLLHNIGMVSVPDQLLNKPGPLSLEEKKIIQAHPALAQMLVKGSMKLEAVLPAILYHHERYDGNGYPNGLRGEEIPFLARVLAVVESYHAMISVRPYRPRMSRDEALSELRVKAGSQFDTNIVETFIKLVNI